MYRDSFLILCGLDQKLEYFFLSQPMTWQPPNGLTPKEFLNRFLVPRIDYKRQDPVPIPVRTNVVADVSLAPRPKVPSTKPKDEDEVVKRSTLISMFPNTQIRPNFGAVVVRFAPPVLTFLVWKNLSVVAAGSKSVHQTALALQHFRMILALNNYMSGLWNLSINNRVYSFDLHTTINTGLLQQQNPLYFFADEKLFPGMFHYIYTLEICMLFFDTGKGVGMGSAPEAELEDYMRKMFAEVLRSAATRGAQEPPKKSADKALNRKRMEFDVAPAVDGDGDEDGDDEAGGGKANFGATKKMLSTAMKLFQGSQSHEEVKARWDIWFAYRKKGQDVVVKLLEAYQEKYASNYESFHANLKRVLKFNPNKKAKPSAS